MTLVIENLPDRVIDKLSKQAKASGRSIEAEAAVILEEATDANVAPGEQARLMLDKLYGDKRPQNVVDEFLAERRALWGEKD